MPGKKVLILGYGSVGKKHAAAFSAEGAQVIVCSKNPEAPEPKFAALGEALKEKPDLVVVCSVTSQHFEDLKKIRAAGFSGVVLMEKPLFEKLPPQTADLSQNCYVTYNLRFHPCIQYLRHELKGKKVLLATIYCGQYLPTWRPQIDYRKNYSAHRNQGGGVLRDLSHELDYMTWLFGDFKKLSALVGKVSDLEIDSDDTCSLIGETTSGAHLSMNVNYLDRNVRRALVIVTEEATYHVDMIECRIVRNKDLVPGLYAANTYELQAAAALAGNFTEFASFAEGLNVVREIEKIEEAARLQKVLSL